MAPAAFALLDKSIDPASNPLPTALWKRPWHIGGGTRPVPKTVKVCRLSHED